MKYAITENQHKMMAEENIRRLCYAIWDKQKKKGEEQKIKQVQKTMFGGQGIPKTKEQIDSLMNDPLWDQ
jgi:hypothetical protein